MPAHGKTYPRAGRSRRRRSPMIILKEVLTMPAATYAGHSVAVNDEGFLVDPAQWTEDMAPQIAKSAGIEELTGAALADHQVHAGRIPGQGDRRHRPRPRQDLPRQHQGAVPAVPQGTGQDCREDRRDSQSATSTSRWPRSATRACTSRPWLAPCRDARADDQLRKMGKLDIPPIPEFIEMIAETGSASTAARHPATCSGSPKMTSSSRSKDIIAVGEFYAPAAGGQIIFT